MDKAQGVERMTPEYVPDCRNQTELIPKMNGNAKKILIETESHEVFILRSGTGVGGFCQECGIDVSLFTIDGAISESGLTAVEILERITSGRLHIRETASGHLLICSRSLEEEDK